MKPEIKLPDAPRGIQKGVPLKFILNEEAVHQMATNISIGFPEFPEKEFIRLALNGLDELELMPRGHHISRALKETLPEKFEEGVEILINSMTPAGTNSEIGTGLFFYLPYSCYLGEFGLSSEVNEDSFPAAMRGMYELTQRFTSEWAIRNYLLQDQERTLAHLMTWMDDPSTDVRRFVSEGTRPILPWGKKLPAILNDPSLTLPILEKLKNDHERYVTRSVANHLGDLSKQNAEWVFSLCHRWLDEGADKEVKWLIRHAVRYHAKKEHPEALALRKRAK